MRALPASGWRFVACIGAALALVCEVGPATARDDGVRARDTGCTLTLDPPDGYLARHGRDGIVLQPVGQENRRGIDAIRLSFGPGADTATLTQVRPMGATSVRYRLTREDGGSGGEEITLVAERRSTAGLIRLEATIQRDDGIAPDFGPAWTALSRVRCAEGLR